MAELADQEPHSVSSFKSQGPADTGSAALIFAPYIVAKLPIQRRTAGQLFEIIEGEVTTFRYKTGARRRACYCR